jgi:CRISPR/Cas system-associated endonuclease Cas1
MCDAIAPTATAAKQALARGLVTKAELGEVEKVLKPLEGSKDDNTDVHLAAGLQTGAGATPENRVENQDEDSKSSRRAGLEYIENSDSHYELANRSLSGAEAKARRIPTSPS